jgi:hypothetical protein
MERYSNRGGNGSVAAFEIGPGFIKLRFRDCPSIYVYNGNRPGPAKVAQMQHLARAGQGLSTFVNRFVRADYDQKIDLETTDAGMTAGKNPREIPWNQ